MGQSQLNPSQYNKFTQKDFCFITGNINCMDIDVPIPILINLSSTTTN